MVSATRHVMMWTCVQDWTYVHILIGHVAVRTCVQDWTCIRILTGPVATDHWTEAKPFLERDRNPRARVGILVCRCHFRMGI